MGAYFRMGAYIREDLVRTEMGAYIHGVPLSQFYGNYTLHIIICMYTCVVYTVQIVRGTVLQHSLDNCPICPPPSPPPPS